MRWVMTFGYLDTGSWKRKVATGHQAQYRNKMIFSLAWMHELGLSGLHEPDWCWPPAWTRRRGRWRARHVEKKVYNVEFTYLPEWDSRTSPAIPACRLSDLVEKVVSACHLQMAFINLIWNRVLKTRHGMDRSCCCCWCRFWCLLFSDKYFRDQESQTETKLEWQEMKKYRLTTISSQRLYLRRWAIRLVSLPCSL